VNHARVTAVPPEPAGTWLMPRSLAHPDKLATAMRLIAADGSLSTRIDLTSVAFYEYRQQELARGLPPGRYGADRDVMAAFISGLPHYANWRGIDFDKAVTAGPKKYGGCRALERHPYAIGTEVRRHPVGRLPKNSARAAPSERPRRSGPGGKAS